MVRPGRDEAPLHRINPIRIGWARDLIARHFKLETQVRRAARTESDLLEVGCGGRIVRRSNGATRPKVVGHRSGPRRDRGPPAITPKETGATLRLSHGDGRGAGGGPRLAMS